MIATHPLESSSMEPLLNDLKGSPHAQGTTQGSNDIKIDVIVHEESTQARMLYHQRLLYVHHARDSTFGSESHLPMQLPFFRSVVDFCNAEFVDRIYSLYKSWPITQSGFLCARPCDFSNHSSSSQTSLSSGDSSRQLAGPLAQKELLPRKRVPLLKRWKRALVNAMKPEIESKKGDGKLRLTPLPAQLYKSLSAWHTFMFEIRCGYLFLYALPDINAIRSDPDRTRRSSIQSHRTNRTTATQGKTSWLFGRKLIGLIFSGNSEKSDGQTPPLSLEHGDGYTTPIHLVYYAPLAFAAASALDPTSVSNSDEGSAHRIASTITQSDRAPIDLDVYDGAQLHLLISLLVPGEPRIRVDHWLVDFSDGAVGVKFSDTASAKSLATLRQQRKDLIQFVEALRQEAKCAPFIASPQYASENSITNGNWLKHVPDRIYSMAAGPKPPTSEIQIRPVVDQPSALGEREGPPKPISRSKANRVSPALRRIKSLSEPFAQLQAQFSAERENESPSVIAVDTLHSLYANLAIVKRPPDWKRPSSVAEVSKAVVAKMIPLTRTLSNPTRRQTENRLQSSLLDRTSLAVSLSQSSARSSMMLQRSFSAASSPKVRQTFRTSAGDFDLVPPILVRLVEKIEAFGMQAEGLYRLSGNSRTVQSLKGSVVASITSNASERTRQQSVSGHSRSLSDGLRSSSFLEGAEFDVLKPHEQDVHVLTGCIKAFFREGFPQKTSSGKLTQEPWTVGDQYEGFVESAKIPDYAERMIRIQDLVHMLPEATFVTLKFFCQHLQRVSMKEAVNRMSVTNLALIFGPTLLRSPAQHDSVAKLMQDMPYLCSIVENFIEHVNWIFGPIEFEDASQSYASSSYTPSESQGAPFSKSISQNARVSFTSQSSQTNSRHSQTDLHLLTTPGSNSVYAIPKRLSSLSTESCNPPSFMSSSIKV